MTATFQAVANDFFKAFQQATRDDGSRYYCLKEGSPEWMRDAIYAAHNDRLPDDWIYEACCNLAGAIEDRDDADSARDDVGEIADSAVDIYTHDLLEWAKSHHEYVDQAAEEYGITERQDLVSQLSQGQCYQLMEIANVLIGAIEAETERRDELTEDAENAAGDAARDAQESP